MLLCGAALTRIADADTKAWILITPKFRLNGGESVMSAITPALAESQRAERDAEVVHYHQELVDRDALRCEEFPHGDP